MAYKLMPYENLYAMKCDLQATLVVIMKGHRDNRELKLEAEITRAICRNEIHELILTNETGHNPGDAVNKIAYLGFAEFRRGGVVAVGDQVTVGGRDIGQVLGYDMTHMPNHMNLILFSPELFSGAELGLKLGDLVRFSRNV